MAITKKERPIIKKIKKKLIKKGFINKKLRPQILIQSLIYKEKKYDFTISKSTGILSKFIVDQHQPIIKGKMLEKA